MFRLALLGLMLLATACGEGRKSRSTSPDDMKAQLTAAAETIIIGTTDGKKIFADHVPVPHARATIILFHQAGSSAYEYQDIAPRLNAAGYSTLAVDQRSGGSLYGPNRTVNKYGRSDTLYIHALPDLDAALNWAQLQGQPVILLGSSYSAGLIFRTAADNPDLVTALIAFSPGEYFGDKSYVRRAAASVKAPVFVTQAMNATEVARSRPIYNALPGSKKIFFQPHKGGIHGASTLRVDRNPAGAEENWQAMIAFIAGLHLRPS